jgi:Trypsin
MSFAARRRGWLRGAPILFAAAFAGACSSNPLDSKGEPVGTTSEPIINGFDSVASQNFVVLVVHPISDTNYYECSGTLVAPNLVLTARHCVSATEDVGFTCNSSGVGSSGGDIGADFDPMSILIFTGLTRPTDYGSPMAYGAQVFHDTSTNLCNHDLALIGLSQSLSVPSSNIAALRLSPLPTSGETITAVGWGVTTSTESPVTRQQRTDIPILNVGPYTDPDGNDVAPNEFDDGESICEGDSGSPALDSSNAVIGVASRGGNNTAP